MKYFNFLFQGGLVYVCVKSALGIYQRYYNNIRNKSRRILDYPQSDDWENIIKFVYILN